ncbi:hypothetical protein AB6O49_12670 [Streptomyces sp. SBR177]
MRRCAGVLTWTAVALTAAAVLAGCSGGGAEPAAPRTTAAAEVCGGFARDAATAAALKGVMGAERYEEGRATPTVPSRSCASWSARGRRTRRAPRATRTAGSGPPPRTARTSPSS